MAIAIQPYMTLAEFDTWASEHYDRNYEFIGGNTIEQVSNSLTSRVTFKIGGLLFAYLQAHPIGEATTADGGYMVNGERYIPDIGFIRTERITTLPNFSLALRDVLPPSDATPVHE